MTEMIERAARAICREGALRTGFRLDELELDSYVDQWWFRNVGEARAAIETLRVPTDAMCLAGQRASADPTGSMSETWGVAPYLLKAAFPAMIDAILKETTE